MKKKADSCLIAFILVVYFCITIFATTAGAEEPMVIVEEIPTENVVINIETLPSGDSAKLGAKAFVDSIFSGSFFKKVYGINETKVEESTLEPVENNGWENIVVEEQINVDSGEIINIEEVVVEETAKDNLEQKPKYEGSSQTVDLNGVPTNYVRYVDMQATAYCLCKKCCGKDPSHPAYGHTASGLVITPGTNMKVLSVDPNVIELGTKCYVQGLNGAWDYGYSIAADTGGAIKGNRVDLYFDTHQAALQWGRKSVRIYILPDE